MSAIKPEYQIIRIKSNSLSSKNSTEETKKEHKLSSYSSSSPSPYSSISSLVKEENPNTLYLDIQNPFYELKKWYEEVYKFLIHPNQKQLHEKIINFWKTNTSSSSSYVWYEFHLERSMEDLHILPVPCEIDLVELCTRIHVSPLEKEIQEKDHLLTNSVLFIEGLYTKEKDKNINVGFIIHLEKKKKKKFILF